MNPKLFLLLNLALAFYLAGAIWAIEVDIFRSWKFLRADDFHIVAMHWLRTLRINAYAGILLAWAILAFGL